MWLWSSATAFGLHGEDPAHDGGQAVPVGGVPFELPAAGAGDGVELGRTVILAGAPLGGDPPALLEADEGGIDGALVEEDLVAAGLLDAASDAVAVLRAHGDKGLEDHEIEGSLEEVELRLSHFGFSCANTT